MILRRGRFFIFGENKRCDIKRSSGKIYLISLAVVLTIHLVFFPSDEVLAIKFAYTTIDFADAYETRAIGINDLGDIVGTYPDATQYSWVSLFGRGLYYSHQ